MSNLTYLKLSADWCTYPSSNVSVFYQLTRWLRTTYVVACPHPYCGLHIFTITYTVKRGESGHFCVFTFLSLLVSFGYRQSCKYKSAQIYLCVNNVNLRPVSYRSADFDHQSVSRFTPYTQDESGRIFYYIKLYGVIRDSGQPTFYIVDKSLKSNAP